VPDLTPDDVYPTALLVEEEVQRSEGELDSKYIKVVRVFETLQGPEINSFRYNERGDLEEVISQQVTPTTPPTADGLLVTQSQVIKDDVSKATKTTATVPSHSTLTSKEKKEGLLGETFITDNIVDPTTLPDALSTTVISSSVEQTSKTKARKRTVTSTGPTSLSKKNKDGKLLGDTDVVRSVVAPTTLPDLPSALILSSEVDQTDSGKAIKTNIVLNSTPILNGSKNSQGLLGETTTEEKVVPAGTSADILSLNIVSSQVEPIDSIRSRKVTETSSGPTSLSGDSFKDGLFGITKITEEIVPNGTLPNILDFNTISSEVTPIDKSKSKKTTVKQTPVTLKASTLSPSELGLVTSTKTQNIVYSGQKPTNDLYTISDNIDSIDQGKAKREVIKANYWPQLTGIEYDDTLGIGNFYTKEIIDPKTYKGKVKDPATGTFIPKDFTFDANPMDEFKSLKKDYDLNLIGQQLESIYYIIDSTMNITLPDTLLAVTAYFGLSGGSGTDQSNAAGAGTSYNYSISGSSKSSSSARGDIYFKIKKGFTGSIKCKEHNFFLKTIDLSTGTTGITTQESVLNKINKNQKLSVGSSTSIQYENWPIIRTVTENIIVIAGSKSKSIGSGESASMSLNGSSTAVNDTTSFDVDVSVNSITLPEALHDQIIIEKVPIGSMDPSTSVTYDVQPPLIEATSFKSFPVGNYLISSSIELYKFGYSKIKGITIEITQDYI
jgi:hypothetical protein